MSSVTKEYNTFGQFQWLCDIFVITDYSNARKFSSNTALDKHVVSRAVFDSIAVYIYMYIYIYIHIYVYICMYIYNIYIIYHWFMVFCLFENFAKDRSPGFDVSCVFISSLFIYLFIYYS